MTCYSCDGAATTREHVPPRSFFPKGRRGNLLTVPSCYAHNHDQSLDIEYVRNVIAGFYGTNAEGGRTFEAAKRSFDRSSALFHQTFRDFERMPFNGEEAATFRVDLERVKSVMRPIANALYFLNYGERYKAQWNVFVTSLKMRADLAGDTTKWQSFRDLLSSFQVVAKRVPQRDVFTYAIGEISGGIVLELVFYGSFTTHCFGPTATFPASRWPSRPSNRSGRG
jgi:hypothetical protein